MCSVIKASAQRVRSSMNKAEPVAIAIAIAIAIATAITHNRGWCCSGCSHLGAQNNANYQLEIARVVRCIMKQQLGKMSQKPRSSIIELQMLWVGVGWVSSSQLFLVIGSQASGKRFKHSVS